MNRRLELKIGREETKLKPLQNQEANYSTVAPLEDQAYLHTEQLAFEAKLTKTIRALQKALENKQAQLEKLQQQRDHWLRGLHACTELLNPNPDSQQSGTTPAPLTVLTHHQLKWRTLRQRHLTYRLSTQSLTHLHLLTTDITALQTKIDTLQARTD